MGVIIALTIILLWSAHLVYLLLAADISFTSVTTYLHILLQGYLYTGLFITAHDAMHGTVSKSKTINIITGWVASILFAGMNYSSLRKNHMLHHKYPATNNDPDYNSSSQNFFIWWFKFLLRYTTITQLIIMGVMYNILMLYIPEIKLWFYWIIPAFLGTFQLFYFGTYVPHKQPHTNDMTPHNSRTQSQNNIWAMLSCYFFGYHYEHHESPGTPWWKLYQVKKKFNEENRVERN